MRDLNLGPDTARLIERYKRDCVREAPDFHKPAVETLEATCKVMADMLQRWVDVAWCWHDNCPAQICSGPHVLVKYADPKFGMSNRNVEVIEPYNKIGETFPDVPYTVSRP